MEAKTGKKLEQKTTEVERERFKMMEKSYEETNGVYLRPIFRDYITLACQRTLNVRQMLHEEQ